MFKKLSHLLKAKYARSDFLSQQLQIVALFDLYKKTTKKISPKVECTPQTFKNGILTVRVKSSTAANEMRMLEPQVLEILKKQEKPLVKRIVYRF